MFRLIFKPGAALMQRLTYDKRFVLIAALILPLVGIIALSVQELIDNTIGFAKKERVGLEYLIPVYKLLDAVQVHQSTSTAALAGTDSLRLAEARSAELIASAITAVESVELKLGADLKTEQWSSFKSGWDKLRSHLEDMQPEAGLQKHAAIIADLNNLIADVGDSSNLILDPDLDSYYLMDALIGRAPAVMDVVSQAQAAGTLALAQGVLDPATRDALNAAHVVLLANATSMQRSLKVAQENNATLRDKVEAAATALAVATAAFSDALGRLAQQPSNQPLAAAGLSAKSYFELAATLREAMAAANAATSRALDELLAHRIDRFERKVSVIVGLTALTVIALLYVCIAFWTSFNAAVSGLQRLSTALSEGDLTVKQEDTGRDELSAVGRMISDACGQLRTLTRNVMSVSTPLGTATREMSGIAARTSSDITAQQTQTDQIATAMNEMSSTAREIARNTSSMASAATQAHKEMTETQEVIERSASLIQSLAHDVTSSADVIAKLQSDSDRISMVLDVIKGIAEQTNLLALNAAIEAARAGEQGRGFAVVADEVRTLASQTQQSTQEINEMISRLQSGARDAVSAMTHSQARAAAAVSETGRVRTALHSITTAVESINERNHQIAVAAEEQSAVVETLNQNVVAIRDFGAQTSDGAQKIAAASKQLAGLADSLQTETSRFRI